MEKFDDLEDAPANRFHLWRLLNGIEIVRHMMDTAAGRRDDTIKAGEIAHEQGFGRGAIGVEATIRHWLSATGLIARINDIVVKALEQLEGGDTHFGENGVDLARNGESDVHSHLSVQRCYRPSRALDPRPLAAATRRIIRKLLASHLAHSRCVY
jgi:hypothetical protein